MELFFLNLVQSLFRCPVQALQIVGSVCVCRGDRVVCGHVFGGYVCIFMYNTCVCPCFTLSRALSQLLMIASILWYVPFQQRPFLQSEWYELYCRCESFLWLAHCFQIVIGLYALAHVFHWDCRSVVNSSAKHRNRNRRVWGDGESTKSVGIKCTLSVVTPR